LWRWQRPHNLESGKQLKQAFAASTLAIIADAQIAKTFFKDHNITALIASATLQ
jgi:hypothetical protein